MDSFSLRLTEILEINYHCFKELKINFHFKNLFELRDYKGNRVNPPYWPPNPGNLS